MIAVFVVTLQFPIFDETSFQIKTVQMYEHLSNKFLHIHCRGIKSTLFGDMNILEMIKSISCVPSFEISQSNSDAIWYAVNIKEIFYLIISSSKVS